MASPRRPSCQTDEEWALWLDAATAPNVKPVASPCVDCPKAFARQMRALELCDGIPGSPLLPVRPLDVRERHRLWTAARRAARRAAASA